MTAMILALKLVFPLFVYMALGFGLQKLNFFSKDGRKDLNNLVFKILLPLSVLKSIYASDLKNGIDWNVIIFACAATLVVFFLCWFLMPLFDKRKEVIPVLIQGISKSNYILLGTSMVAMLYGDDIGMAGVLVAFLAPLNNTLSAIAFELYRGDKVKPMKLLKKIITNPLVGSGLIGIALNLSGLQIPDYFITQIVSKLSAMATPLAMITLGAGFSFGGLRKYAKHITVVSLGRLVLVPAVELLLLIVLGFNGPNMMALLIAASTPTAVNSYNTALSMGGDGELAGALVAVTSILSVVTMFVWFSIASGMGMM